MLDPFSLVVGLVLALVLRPVAADWWRLTRWGHRRELEELHHHRRRLERLEELDRG